MADIDRPFLGDEAVFDLALKLLRKEPEEQRVGLVRWAVRELERTHHIHLFGLINYEDDFQALGDLFLENPKMKYWLRHVGRDRVLAAEDFRDLVDRITPIRRYDSTVGHAADL